MSCNIHTLSWFLLMTGGKMRRWCHQTTFCFLYHLKQHVHVTLDLEVTDHRWNQNMVRASLTYLAAPCMLCFCSYHIITLSHHLGLVMWSPFVNSLSLSLVLSIMCIWFWPHYFAMYRMFWIILFVVVDIFLQTSDVARYLLFTDRKKYPVKRGGTYLRCSTFVSKCEHENLDQCRPSTRFSNHMQIIYEQQQNLTL